MTLQDGLRRTMTAIAINKHGGPLVLKPEERALPISGGRNSPRGESSRCEPAWRCSAQGYLSATASVLDVI